MHYQMDPARHAAIFGPRDDLEPDVPGRKRRCRVCGDWHRTDRPWPHNCRPEAAPRNRDLSTPQIAPPFEPFKAGAVEEPEVISSRNDKREYMKRHDLVEYDSGVGDRNEWVEQHEERREIVDTLKRFHETDPLNLSPEQKGLPMEEGSLEEGTEIETDDIEVIK